MAYDFYMNELRENIRKELAMRGWKYTELADRAGVPAPTINRFLNRRHHRMNDKTVKKLAKGFGINEAILRYGSIDAEFKVIKENASITNGKLLKNKTIQLGKTPVDESLMRPHNAGKITKTSIEMNPTNIKNLLGIKDEQIAWAVFVLANIGNIPEKFALETVIKALSIRLEEIKDPPAEKTTIK